ncbi:MAG TPA: hypothetical protein VE935_00355, partial [Burkholderiales bacterium]|nr:hypothetical protein [Burkholderiales bacterium]
ALLGDKEVAQFEVAPGKRPARALMRATTPQMGTESAQTGARTQDEPRDKQARFAAACSGARKSSVFP